MGMNFQLNNLRGKINWSFVPGNCVHLLPIFTTKTGVPILGQDGYSKILRTLIMYGCPNGATTIVTFSKTITCNYAECHIFFCYAEYRDADLTKKGYVKRRFQPDVRQTFLKFDNEVILWIPTLGAYSQSFIFILTYKWVQYARMLHFEPGTNISFLCSFESSERYELLWIWPQAPSLNLR